MSEIEFADKFPSLKKIVIQDNPLNTIKKQIEFGFTKKEAINNLDMSKREILLVDDIEEHCLDKQKVKNIIFKLAIQFGDRDLSQESIWLLNELLPEWKEENKNETRK